MNISKYTTYFVVIFLTTFLAACTNVSNTGSSGYGYGKAAEQEPAAQTITVTIKNFAFEPATVTVSPGDTLVFVNEDSAPHTATASSGAFDTGNLAGGDTGTVTIADAGTYEYFCAIHPAMKGTIVVQ